MANYSTKVNYVTPRGIPVYYNETVHKAPRSVPGDVRFLFAHFTESPSLDTRNYLIENARGVSVHFLTGEYHDTDGPRLYKYASERDHQCFTQGFSLIGDLLEYSHDPIDWRDGVLAVKVKRNANDVSIAYEIDANSQRPPSERLLHFTCMHMAEVIRYWNGLGRQLLLIGHHHADPHKSDPQLNWNDFAKRVYDYL